MSEVFVSYNRSDRSKAKAIADTIAKCGFEVWWDADLLPGDDFREEVEQVINAVNVVVVLWSCNSTESAWVIGEATLARERSILIPVRLDESDPPIDFRSIHTLDLRNWDGSANHSLLNDLVKAIERRLPNSGRGQISDGEADSVLLRAAHEATYWRQVAEKKSQSADEYQAYLEEFGQRAVFAGLARIRIAELRASDSERRVRQRLFLGISTSLVMMILVTVGIYYKFVVLTQRQADLAQNNLPSIANSAAPDVAPLQSNNYWYLIARETLEEKIAQATITGRAKNIILMIAEGQGVGTNMLIRWGVGQRDARSGEENTLPHERLPHLALSKTYDVNSQTPSLGATALHTGIKTNWGVIGVDEGLERGDCAGVNDHAVENIGEILKRLNKSVGYVSTGAVTDGSTAGGYAKSADISYSNDVRIPSECEQKDHALQLISLMKSKNVDVAMGGGRDHFRPAAEDSGNRNDGRNLIVEAQQAGVRYVSNAMEFDRLDLGSEAPIIGLFNNGHMNFAASRDQEPSLADMTAAALEVLSLNEEGFYLQVVAGRIDHVAHEMNIPRIVDDGFAFAEAVETVMNTIDLKETLLIVTASHEMSIGFNGYCGRGSPVTGPCYLVSESGQIHTSEHALDMNGESYPLVGFLNGPPSDPNEDESSYLRSPAVLMEVTTHSPEDVAVYAGGPWAHLIDGTIEQNVVFHVMLFAATYEEPGMPARSASH